MKPRYPNILILAGTGRNSGKTTIACEIIRRFAALGIVGAKTSGHFHNDPGPLRVLSKGSGYFAFRETQLDSGKDSSRMLKAGASAVYYVEVKDDFLSDAFGVVLRHIPKDVPVVWESPALKNLIQPGALIIADSTHVINKKEKVLSWKNEADVWLDTTTDAYLSTLDHLQFDRNGWSIR